MLTYNLSEKTLSKAVHEVERSHQNVRCEWRDVFHLCHHLSILDGITNSFIKDVAEFIVSQPESTWEFHMKLLSKTLRLGVTAKTVNKVIPGLIPEWEVQQAYPIEKYPLKDGEEFYVTQKLNGVRATFYKGKLYARSGVPFSGLDHIIFELNAINDSLVSDFVFDGELLLDNKEGLSDNEAFRIATGIINSDEKVKTGIRYTIFDVIDVEEFESGDESVDGFGKYSDRRMLMDYCLDVKTTFVNVLPLLYSGTDQSMIDKLLNKMVEEDKEGLMVNLDVPYQRKRHRGILKVKRFYTMDLPIIRCEEGTGRLAGTLGSLIVDFDGSEVGVGSGFTDEDRAWVWENRESVVGAIVEVKYKEISYDKKTGKRSLQFPVFVCMRNDKDSVNYE